MKIAMSTAGSGVYPQNQTGSFPPVAPFTPALQPRRRVDVYRMPAAVIPRQRRAPPPADADYDVLVYLAMAVLFLLTVWR